MGLTPGNTLEVDIVVRNEDAKRKTREFDKATEKTSRNQEKRSRSRRRDQSLEEQALERRAKAQRTFGRQLESTERKASTFGKRGLARLKAQEQQFLRTARAAGATSKEIDRGTAAFRRMERQIERNQRQGRGRGGAGAGGLLAAGRGVGVAAGALGIGIGLNELIQLGRETVNVSSRIEALGRNLDVLAKRYNITRESIRGTERELRMLGLTELQARETIQKLTIARVEQAKIIDFVRGALDAAVRMNITFDQATADLATGLLRTSPLIIDNLGVVVKLGDAQRRYAEQLGLSSAQLLSAEQKQMAFNEAVREALAQGGEFEANQGRLGRSLLEIEQIMGRVQETAARLFHPVATAGANLFVTALGGVERGLLSIERAWDNLSPVTRAAITGGLRGLFPAAGLLGLGGGGASEQVPLPGDPEFVGPLQPPRARPTVPPPAVPPPRVPRGRRPAGPAGQAAAALAVVNRQIARFGGRPTPVDRTLFDRGQEAFRRGQRGADEAQRREEEAHADRIRRTEELADAQARAANEAARIAISENDRIFQSFKNSAGQVFDAMLLSGRGFFNGLADAMKLTLLTAMREILSSSVARTLMGVFGGRGAGGLGLGGLVGLGGGLFGGGLGGVGRPGAPGGTPGIVAPVGGARGGLTSAASVAGLGGLGVGGIGAFLRGGRGQHIVGLHAGGGGLGGALTSNASALGGAGLLAAGLARGGLSGIGMSAAGGALIGARFGGPLGALIGGAAGGVAGFVRSLFGSARDNARDKIQAAYGIRVQDKPFLDWTVQLARSSYFGNLDVAIRAPEFLDRLTLFQAARGGQLPGGFRTGIRSPSLVQRGGELFQAPQFRFGRAFAFESRLPTIMPSTGGPVISLKLDGEATTRLQRGEVVNVMAEEPRLVQDAATRAQKGSFGRRVSAAVQLQPTTVLA